MNLLLKIETENKHVVVHVPGAEAALKRVAECKGHPLAGAAADLLLVLNTIVVNSNDTDKIEINGKNVLASLDNAFKAPAPSAPATAASSPLPANFATIPGTDGQKTS